MDKSELFIKQCDCDEIQDNHELSSSDHDVFAYDNNQIYTLEVWGQGSAGDWFPKKMKKDGEKITWLPHQDQIQGMMNKVEYMITIYHTLFQDKWLWTISWDSEHSDDNFESLEQLWISFYMKMKYGKKWDSKEEKWVKE